MSNATANQSRDLTVLLLGAALVASCIAVAHYAPTTFQSAFVQMRVLTALGGALLGTALPGLIGIEIKGIRAIGAASFVVLFFLFTPLARPSSAANDPSPQTQTTASAVRHAADAAGPPASEGAAPTPAQDATTAAEHGAAPKATRMTNSPVCQGDNCSQSTTYYQQSGDRDVK